MDTTVQKAFTILEVLARSDARRGITDLAGELGLSKSNVHRLLSTLIQLGYVVNEDGRYGPTSKLWELGSLIIGRYDVRRLARPTMEVLARQSGETVHLSVLDEISCEVVYIDKIESVQAVRAYSEVGGRAPAHCVATGKALLAELPDAALLALGGRLTAHARRSITTVQELLRQVAQIRRDRFAVNHGEWRESVRGVASVIRGADGRAAAAIGISGPAGRLTQDFIRRTAPMVVEAGDTVSRLMGGSRPATQVA